MLTCATAPPADEAARIAARNRLAEDNLGLVRYTVVRMGLGHRHDLDDLEQEGRIALMRAAESFDPARGFAFSTYAVWAIRRCLVRFLLTSELIHLPAHLPAAYDRTELRARLDPVSLSAMNAEGKHVFDLPAPDDLPSPEIELLADRRDRVDAALCCLDWRSRAVVTMRRDGTTLKSCGRILGVSRERIRQIEALALEKLRRVLGIEGEEVIEGDGSEDLTSTASPAGA
jgi:RNA polymerase sigma factor (sigma-70 family)